VGLLLWWQQGGCLLANVPAGVGQAIGKWICKKRAKAVKALQKKQSSKGLFFLALVGAVGVLQTHSKGDLS